MRANNETRPQTVRDLFGETRFTEVPTEILSAVLSCLERG